MSTHQHVRVAPESTAPPDIAVEAIDLTKTYGTGDKAVHALAGISLSVPAGTVFGMLGPNGAGKSTTTKILTTLARADEGHARVAGFDVERDAAAVRHAIGYVPQKPCFDPTATGWENLSLQGRIYGMPKKEIARRGTELLERFGLAEAANRLTKKWSGGMQRKLDVALALIHHPQVLFLDEPTTGLDPEARADMWAEIAGLSKTSGLTVVLTTHYLEEADNLADNLVIIDHGRVVATGTPDELKGQLEGETIQIQLADPEARDVAVAAVTAIDGVHDVSVDDATLRANVTDGASNMARTLVALDSSGVEIASVTLARPSLDDVYLRHAGRSFRAADEAGTKEAA
ncbi:ATP-binding cassette domain-containing protein [Actinobacteria bacterium YIM 96077]|uniref:ABC transporter n=1 Tax=Phytoactinopolyspora halophila TaxID=1981511 RepID=A0A329QNY7_9ACTN|nr:ATP-binding cassette domain-containing protein [Phytoactinopolyspora halophila]AYY14539.1 ATP-binding cassette domain-containing protein [Actinobacteria bacterium YIM 96077]RAW14084.1 ABC transporter [Phytoactinopolyspora halophila]